MAVKPRAAAEAPNGADGIMPTAALRLLLATSKQKPVGCAVALTKDKEAILLLHRTMRPKKVMAELRKQAAAAKVDLDLTTLRFGRATVDGASDSQCVNVSVNKQVPNANGFEMKLRERVKPAGYKRCSLTVDAALDGEPEEDAPAGAALGAPAPARPADAAPAPDTASGNAASSPGSPTAPPAGAAPAMVPTAAAQPGGALAVAERPVPPRGSSAGEAGVPPPGAAAPLERRLAAAVKRMSAFPHPEPDAEQARRQAARLGRDALREGDLARAERVTSRGWSRCWLLRL